MLDWKQAWFESTERNSLKAAIQDMNKPSQKPTPSESQASRKYAASLFSQLQAVTIRTMQKDWRTPSYLLSKLLLCAGSVGLSSRPVHTLTIILTKIQAFFIGFSFWMTDNSIQGIQDQVFSVFLLMTIHSNCAQLIIAKFNENRELFEARERPANIYSWQAFLCANIVSEIPSQTLAAVLEFVCWYYPVGMFRNAAASGTEDTSQRPALIFLFLLVYSYFSPTFSIALAAGLDQAGVAVNIGQLFYFLSLIFCG